MFLDFRIRQLAPNRLQPRKGALFVRAHQARVARHIGGKNGGQPAFDAFRGQSGAPQPHGPNRLSALGGHSNGKRERWHSLWVRQPMNVSPTSATSSLADAPPDLGSEALEKIGIVSTFR